MSKVEVWRGGVAPWECDQMGHLNVRFHLERAANGLVGLAAALGMPGAFAAGAAATLTPVEQHVRFLREAVSTSSLHMTGGVLSIGEDEAELLQVLHHSGSGEPATAYTTRVAHTTADGRRFPWGSATRARAEALRTERPRYAAVRGATTGPAGSADLTRAQAMGLELAGLTAVFPRDCDALGRLTVEGVISRIADGVSGMVDSLRGALADAPPGSVPEMSRIGGAVVEYRALYHAWPRAGDRVAVWAGLAGFDARTRRMVYWLLDPETGRTWATAELVSMSFDLEARKGLVLPPSAAAKMQAAVIPGLTV
jgi:acyl-CoA thioester hydrolase